ncbi:MULTISPECIES: hypothetical protein [unclassified Serratia (in: enterobacteria)]|uniref:hypothetical protein n=1 Tax=unclassified Serratia (in: enterobacteria) TaxID=2647522 RepID=UPI0030760B7D
MNVVKKNLPCTLMVFPIKRISHAVYQILRCSSRLSKTTRRVHVGIAILSLMAFPNIIFAACLPSPVSNGTTICDTSNVQSTPVGTGPGLDNVTLNITPSAQIDITDTIGSAISLGNGAVITIGNNAFVQNNGDGAGTLGPWGTGYNTIEFGSLSTLLIQSGAQVRSVGASGQVEAINPAGFANTITNYGLIYAKNSSAIWLQNKTNGASNVINNYGTIQTDASSGIAIGESGSNGLNFTNYTGSSVIGHFSLGGGADNLVFHNGSTVTGRVDGGGAEQTH